MISSPHKSTEHLQSSRAAVKSSTPERRPLLPCSSCGVVKGSVSPDNSPTWKLTRPQSHSDKLRENSWCHSLTLLFREFWLVLRECGFERKPFSILSACWYFWMAPQYRGISFFTLEVVVDLAAALLPCGTPNTFCEPRNGQTSLVLCFHVLGELSL